jgi:hypothetical protein
MARKIVITIDSQGRVEADFVSFPGNSCKETEHKLRAELARWGVLMEGVVLAKNETQVLQELAEEERCRQIPYQKIRI